MGKIEIISKERGTGIYESTSNTWEYVQKIVEGHITENSENIIIINDNENFIDNEIIINKECVHANTPEFITYRINLKFGGGLQILLDKYKKRINSYQLKGFYSESFKIKFEADSGFIDQSLNDPNFNPIYTKKQFLNGQELALLYQALMKKIFAVPEKGYLLFEPHNGGGYLYFDTNYFDELIESIYEKFFQGKLAESNAEFEWIQLTNKLSDAEDVIEPNISECSIYSVSK